jgi:hypothetical protein
MSERRQRMARGAVSGPGAVPRSGDRSFEPVEVVPVSCDPAQADPALAPAGQRSAPRRPAL